VSKLIHEQLSYQVRGVLFDVYNSLGPLLPEKYYTEAIEIGLKDKNIRCEIEKPFEVFYQDSRVGLYYVDVWIENGNLILENKVSPEISDLHRAQAISYLKVTDADLAFLVNFGGST
jgi:GxxExxY protein